MAGYLRVGDVAPGKIPARKCFVPGRYGNPRGGGRILRESRAAGEFEGTCGKVARVERIRRGPDDPSHDGAFP